MEAEKNEGMHAQVNDSGISQRQLRRIISKKVQQHIIEARSQVLPHQNLDVGVGGSNLVVSSNGTVPSDSESDSDDDVSRVILTSSESEVESNSHELPHHLRNWAIMHNKPGTTLQDLLKILRYHKCFSSLPVDQRTLLRPASKDKYVVQHDENSSYCYFGIRQSILGQLEHNHIPSSCTKLRVAISIDGLPISRSN